MVDYSVMNYKDFNVGDRIRIDRRIIKTDELGKKMRFEGKTGTIRDRTPSFVKIRFDDEDIFYQWEDGRKDYGIWFMVDEIEYEEQEE